jgi:hypothetical protein
MGKLFFDASLDTLCDPIPQQEFITKDAEYVVDSLFMPPFMIADRGGCPFVQKVRNMEEAGVAMGIVVDNSDEDISEIVMSDDGTGAGIRIPSVLISKRDGQKLIDFLRTASKEELEQIAIVA